MNTNVSLGNAVKVPAGAQTTEALVLSCMDFRMMDHVARFLAGKGLREKYDMVTIAGAAIGVMNTEKPSWGETFVEPDICGARPDTKPKLPFLASGSCGSSARPGSAILHSLVKSHPFSGQPRWRSG